MDIELSTRWFLRGKERAELPAELITLLDGIRTGGNLRYAARHGKLSYRHAWGLVKTWEKFFGHSLVALERGRGATLTEAGEILRETWHKAEDRTKLALEDAASFAARELEPITRLLEESEISIVASHSFGVNALATLLREAEVSVNLQILGSEQSLARYAQGLCRVAGFHLPEGELGSRVWQRFLPALDPKRDVLLLVESRELGFMSRPDNLITGVRDIARRKLRFFNRQPGSGSRLVFDLLLADANLKASSIPGYHHEEYTHLAVAAVVAAGEADCAFGVRAAAERFGLAFHQEVNEQYLLVLPREAMHRKPFSLLKQLLSSQAYKQALGATAGTDARGSGRVLDIKQVAALLHLPARRRAPASNP
jgi:molybdate transport repressor ModE-like protein